MRSQKDRGLHLGASRLGCRHRALSRMVSGSCRAWSSTLERSSSGRVPLVSINPKPRDGTRGLLWPSYFFETGFMLVAGSMELLKEV